MTRYIVSWCKTPTAGQIKVLDAYCCTNTFYGNQGTWFIYCPLGNIDEIVLKAEELGISIEDLERI